MNEPIVASYGGGTNSTAMLIEMVRRGEHFDAVLFSDTGGERPRTYQFLREFSEWLVAHDCPPITVVRHMMRDGTFQSLEDECLTKGTLPSIAFGFKKCSGKFKLEPQDKWTNHWDLARGAWRKRDRVWKLIGFGIDERRRADKGNEYQSEGWHGRYRAGEEIRDIAISVVGEHRVPRERSASWDQMLVWANNQLRNSARRVREAVRFRKRYPLIEYEMGREECVETIRSEGLTLPGKSACFYCPSNTKDEIIALSKPLQRRALRMEANALPNLTNVKGLGRRFAWADFLAGADVAQSEADTTMPCDCTDGDEP